MPLDWYNDIMLYIIGTPIGNIEDTSFRAIRTLTHTDVILAEDTRTFHTYYGRIQNLFGMKPAKKQVVRSFYKENEFSIISDVLEMLKNGIDIALVSESGMPGISDPGTLLIKHVRMNQLPYTVIPGPTALITAAVISGISFQNILFLGFLEKKEHAMLNKLRQTKNFYSGSNTLVICYESPHRVHRTIKLIRDAIHPEQFIICRELTKKFEEVIAITPQTDIDKLKLKGELVLLFSLP